MNIIKSAIITVIPRSWSSQNKYCRERTNRRRIADIAEINVSAADDLLIACKQANPSIFSAKACEAISLITDLNFYEGNKLFSVNFEMGLMKPKYLLK